jgi:hypothetical protein
MLYKLIPCFDDTSSSAPSRQVKAVGGYLVDHNLSRTFVDEQEINLYTVYSSRHVAIRRFRRVLGILWECTRAPIPCAGRGANEDFDSPVRLYSRISRRHSISLQDTPCDIK